MRKLCLLAIAIITFSFRIYDTNYYALSGGAFTQNWTNTTLITANDNWAGVASIQGFLGQDITTATGIDPQTLLTGSSSVANDLDVIANQSNTTISNGGVAEFDGIPNPTIALQGSGTADAPHLIIYLNTTSQSSVRVQYNVRDIDGTADNAVQQVALQYRIGSTGNFTNLAAGYIADATTGPSIATLVTAVDVTLPIACNNQPQVEVRIMSTNATGSDEWVGIDDINITSSGTAGPLSITTSSPLAGGTIGMAYSQTILAFGGTPTYAFSLLSGTLPTGTSLATSGAITGTPTASGTFNFTVQVTDGASATSSKAFAITIINAPCNPPTHTIAEIQGTSNASPFVGNVETTSGVVTGVRSNGFFMQTPDANTDANPNTSEGIFVFTSSAPPAAAVIGNRVCVTGTIVEFIPSTDPNSPSQTEIISPGVTVLSTGNPLPAAIVLTSANTNPAGGLYQLEKFESMRVQVNSMTVVAPTQGNKTESAATSVSNGFFYGVITGVARPFREPGVEQPDPLPPGAPVTVPRWDANPELIGVGSNSIGSAAIDVATGAVLTNVVGPLDYRSRVYTIDIDPSITPVVSNNGLTFTAVPAQTADELTVASFNIERFYDDINDPNGDAVLTTTAYNNRLNKVSLAIRNVLRTPDILCIVEVEKLVVLQAIATKVNADAVAAGNPSPNYQAYLSEGNDVGGIDVGFLVKPARVNVTTVTQYGLTTTYTDPTTGLPALLNDRPPLVMNATFTKPGCTTPDYITVIVNHLRSLNGIDDVGSTGTRVRAKRKAQAEFLANLIQGFQTSNPTAYIISAGDYNAFEFSDGYVDLMGTIKGTPTPASDVVVASPDLVNPNLTNLVETYPAAQRYTYSFSGSAQVLDHILVSSNLASKISRFSIARVDADFPEVYRTDANRPERISDHDAPVAYILFTDNINPTITCSGNVTVSCASAVPAVNIASVTASDNCSGVVVTHEGDVISAQTCANRYTITRTYRATDAGGNSAVCSQIITVNDITPPTLTCPAAVTVTCTSLVPVPNITSVTGVSDNCGGIVTITHVGDVISAQTCANRYTITRTYRATDVCGSFAQCTQIISVNDQTAPVIICPSNIAAATPIGSCTAVITFTPTATDNCGGVVTITSVPASGSVFAMGTTPVTVTAVDACGNSSTCTFNVTVTDGQLPVIGTQPANRTVCATSTAIFSVSASNAVSYQWQQFLSGVWTNIAGQTGSSLTFTAVTQSMNTNTYRVNVIGLCTSIISNPASLYVNPLPTINLTASNPPILLPTQTTSLVASVNPTGGTFAWFKNGVARVPTVTTGTLSNLTVDDAGTYKATYTDPNGCVATSGDLVLSAALSERFYVAPNPNNGQFWIRYYNLVNEQLTLIVYNSKGRKVHQQVSPANLPYTRIDVKLNAATSSGIYLVELRGADGRILGAKRIVVYRN